MDANVHIVKPLGSVPAIGCPRKLPKDARLVGTIIWAVTGMGSEWPDTYSLSTSRSGNHWILWCEKDPEDWQDSDIPAVTPVAWCERGNLSDHDASLALLRAWWEVCEGWGHGKPQFYKYEGVLDSDEMGALAELVWPGDDTTMRSDSVLW